MCPGAANARECERRARTDCERIQVFDTFEASKLSDVGEKRFGLHLAVYNSALAIGSSFFNGFAAVATKISDDATDAENAENEGNYVFPTTCRRRSPDLVRETCV